MQFSSPTPALAQAVAVTGNIARAASSSPVFKQILIRANPHDKSLFISGTDGNVATSARIQCDDIEIDKGGHACLPANTIIDYLKSAPGGTIRLETTPTFNVDNTPSGTRGFVKSGKSQLTLQGTHPDDFPAFPRREKLWKWKVDAGELLMALAFVTPCIDQSKGGNYYGVSMRNRDGILELCTFDRTRAAIAESVAVTTSEETTYPKALVIPRAAIDCLVIALATGKGERSVTISAIGTKQEVNGVQFQLNQDQTSYLIRTGLIAVDWPDLKSHISKASKVTIKVNRKDFEKALTRTRLALGKLSNGDDDPYIELSFQKDKLCLLASETGGRKSEEELDAEVSALPDVPLEGRIGISINYLASAARYIDADNVLIDYDAPSHAFLRVRHPDLAMLHGISPMHLREQ